MKTLQGIKLGELVPPIDARDIRGSPISIGYDDGPSATVVYIFTPDCIWCARNLDAIKSLTSHLEPSRRLIGLSLSKEKIESYLAENDIRFPVYIESYVAGRSAYRAGGTPRTLVVSSEGRLIKEWFGAYAGDVKREIEEYFRVTLPEPGWGSGVASAKNRQCEESEGTDRRH